MERKETGRVVRADVMRGSSTFHYEYNSQDIHSLSYLHLTGKTLFLLAGDLRILVVTTSSIAKDICYLL